MYLDPSMYDKLYSYLYEFVYAWWVCLSAWNLCYMFHTHMVGHLEV